MNDKNQEIKDFKETWAYLVCPKCKERTALTYFQLSEYLQGTRIFIHKCGWFAVLKVVDEEEE